MISKSSPPETSAISRATLAVVPVAEKYVTERHTSERFMAVGLSSALIVNSLVPRRRMQQHMIAVIIMLHFPEARENVHQAQTVAVHDQLESLLLIESQNQVILIRCIPVKPGRPRHGAGRLSGSRGSLEYL